VEEGDHFEMAVVLGAFVSRAKAVNREMI